MANEDNKGQGGADPSSDKDSREAISIDGKLYRRNPDKPDEAIRDTEGNLVPFEEKKDKEPDEGDKGGNIDYETKLEEKDRIIREQTEALEKKEKQIGQAGFNIQKLKERLKAEGIDIETEEGGLNETKVREIIASEIQTQIGTVTKDFGNKISEVMRAVKSTKDIEKPGGGSGQKKQVKEYPRPTLSPNDEKIITRGGHKWDPKRGGWVSPSGRFFPHEERETFPSLAK
ncbi:MAG: hypothetical protein ACE5J5_08395 [Candidatus Hydrothermarchaeales archaeon]